MARTETIETKGQKKFATIYYNLLHKYSGQLLTGDNSGQERAKQEMSTKIQQGLESGAFTPQDILSELPDILVNHSIDDHNAHSSGGYNWD